MPERTAGAHTETTPLHLRASITGALLALLAPFFAAAPNCLDSCPRNASYFELSAAHAEPPEAPPGNNSPGNNPPGSNPPGDDPPIDKKEKDVVKDGDLPIGDPPGLATEDAAPLPPPATSTPRFPKPSIDPKARAGTNSPQTDHPKDGDSPNVGSENVRRARALVRRMESQVVDVLNRASRSTVTLISRSRTTGSTAYQPITGAGSGVIVQYGGTFILTNAHVVDTKESMIAITHDGRELAVYALVLERQLDMALLKFVDSDPRVTPVDLTRETQDDPSEGAWVLATGNPFLLAPQGRSAASLGVISGFRKNSEAPGNRLIQHDAEINPGSSGGPLWNTRGGLVGLNGAILTRARMVGTGGPTFTGASVAIPMPQVRAFIESHAGVQVPTAPVASDAPSTPSLEVQPAPSRVSVAPPVNSVVPTVPLGLSMNEAENEGGIVVAELTTNSVFLTGGLTNRLEVGDIITSIRAGSTHYPMARIQDFTNFLNLHSTGEIERVDVLRNGGIHSWMRR